MAAASNDCNNLFSGDGGCEIVAIMTKSMRTFEHVLSAEQGLYQVGGNPPSNTILVYILNSPKLTFLMYQDYLNSLFLAPTK